MSEKNASGPGWLLLIYTVPSQPTRKRAAVWRDLKRLGAVYLRDGVAALPATSDLRERLQAVADRVIDYEGTADLIIAPPFPRPREEGVRQQFQDERAAEYREVYHACVRFLRDVLADVNADEFGFPDVEKLESELTRLRRYYDTIKERDYFGAPGLHRVADILGKCDVAFENFVATAAKRVEPATSPGSDDVFERLGGRASDAADLDVPL